jgi:membrane fusion protein, multidrug efflux system
MSTLYQTHIIAKAEYDNVLAKLNATKAETSQNHAKLEQTVISAPFSGKVGLSQINLGDYVNAGQEIVSLEAINPIEVEFNIPETYLSKIGVGQEIQITSDACPNQYFNGKIYAIDATVNLKNRTIAVRASIPNANNKLLPGVFVEVKIVFSSNNKNTNYSSNCYNL